MPDAPRGTRWMIGALTVLAVGTIAFWVIWYFVDRSWLASDTTREYYVFENSFPAADAWMTICAGLGAWTLFKRLPSALLWMLLAGSASVYLALMDVLFDLENGIYRAPTGNWGGVISEIVINVATLVGGAIIIHFGWRHRNALLTPVPFSQR